MYYHHLDLRALTQDELYSILYFGGVASVVLFVLAVTALTMHFIKQLDQHRGESIFGVVFGTLAKILFWATMYLMFILIFYTLYIYAVGGGTGLNVAEAMEWFYHTDWIAKLPYLADNLDTIKVYGEDAEEIGKNTVVTIYLVRLALTFLLLAFALLVTLTATLKINKLVNAQAVNSFEYGSTMIASSLFGIVVLVLMLGMVNLAMNEIFRVSDLFANTNTASTPVKIEMVYLDIFNPSLLSNITTQQESTNALPY